MVGFSDLPLEILLHIFKYIKLKDMRTLLLVNKEMYNMIINENTLWKNLGRKRQLVHCQLSPHSKLNHTSMSAYHHLRISSNWDRGVFKEKIVMRHKTNYLPWTHMTEKCYSISIGSELLCFPRDDTGFPMCKRALWSVRVPTAKRKKGIQLEDITRYIVKDGYYVCGNRDGCVTIFKSDIYSMYEDPLLGKPVLLHYFKDIYQEKFEVSATDAVVNKEQMQCFVTSSKETSTVKIWSPTPPERASSQFYCSKQITLPSVKGIKCISLNSDQNKLAIGPGLSDGVTVADMETGKLLLGLSPSRLARNAIRDLFWHDGNSIAFGTQYGLLDIVDMRSGLTWYNSVDPFASAVYCLKGDGVHSMMLGAAEYCRCVLYDIRSPFHKQMYFTQKKSSPVYCLEFDSSVLVAAADLKVAALDFNVLPSEVSRRDYSKVSFR